MPCHARLQCAAAGPVCISGRACTWDAPRLGRLRLLPLPLGACPASARAPGARRGHMGRRTRRDGSVRARGSTGSEHACAAQACQSGTPQRRYPSRRTHSCMGHACMQPCRSTPTHLSPHFLLLRRDAFVAAGLERGASPDQHMARHNLAPLRSSTLLLAGARARGSDAGDAREGQRCPAVVRRLLLQMGTEGSGERRPEHSRLAKGRGSDGQEQPRRVCCRHVHPTSSRRCLSLFPARPVSQWMHHSLPPTSACMATCIHVCHLRLHAGAVCH